MTAATSAAPQPPRRDRSKPMALHAWTTSPTIAWFTGEPIRTLCGLEGKPMRPGKQRSGVETGRREPYPCPDCFALGAAQR